MKPRTASLVLALAAALTAADAAAAGDCRQYLRALEAASRNAQEALLIARARGEAPTFAGGLDSLPELAANARHSCAALAVAGDIPDQADDGAPEAEPLPDLGAKPDKDAPDRRTPAERVHGRW